MMRNVPRIVFVSLLAFFLQFSYSLYFQVKPAVDANTYDRIGLSLAEGNGYRMLTPDAPLALDPAIGRTGPGYEYFLATIYKFFGHHISIIWFLQALMAAGTAALVYLLTRLLFTSYAYVETAATIASLLIATNADFITIGSMLLTETLATLLTTLQIYLTLTLPERQKKNLHAVLLGVVMAAAVLVRTNTLLLVGGTALYLIYKKNYKELTLSIVAFILIGTPWILRNESVYHRFIPFNTSLGVNIVTGNNEIATGEFISLLPARLATPLNLITNPVAYNDAATHLALQFIVQHPFQFIELCIKRTVIFLSAARPSAFWFHLHGLSVALTALLSIVSFFLIASFGMSGLYEFIRDTRKDGRYDARALFLIIAGLALAFPIITIIAETRYRFPLYPLFAIFAGWMLVRLWQDHSRFRVPLFFCGFFALITLLDLATHIPVILEKLHSFL